MIRPAFALAVVGVTLAVSQTAVIGQQAPAAPVTFSKDVAPILQKACQNCHRPGAIAPMSLLTYQDARPWARSIKQKVMSREMPPWYIDRHVGINKFKDDPSLSEAEIATIAKWVDQGAPAGNPSDLPAPQSGSPMTYMLNGKQYIIVAVSGGNYSGDLIAFRLPG